MTALPLPTTLVKWVRGLEPNVWTCWAGIEQLGFISICRRRWHAHRPGPRGGSIGSFSTRAEAEWAVLEANGKVN